LLFSYTLLVINLSAVQGLTTNPVL